jgi:uncharacterized protein
MAVPPLQQPAGDAASLGPATRSDAWTWIFTALACLVAGYVLSLLLASIGAAATDARGGAAGVARLASPPLWYLLAGYAGLWAGFGGAAWLVTRSGRTLGLRFRPSDVRFVLLGIALQLVLALAYLPVNQQSLSRPEHVLLGSGNGWALVVPAALVIVGAPLFEELFFRGVLFRGLLGLLAGWRRALGVLCAVVIDGAVFGIIHLGTDSWIQLPGLAAVGVVLATVALRTRRLGPSIVTHASFNALAVYVFVASR